MELELGLALPNNYHFPVRSAGLMGDSFDDNFSEMNYMKQTKANVFDDGHQVERKTLPLLTWNGQPNEGDHPQTTFEAFDQELKEERQVVGWPPIKSWRKKVIYGINDIEQGGWNRNNIVVGPRNSRYVKVKMEGVAIGRKIDLTLYNSYQLLTNSLIQMFAKSDESDDESGSRFTILYQDKQGDWMLVGDVPWQTFMESAQRILLQRNGKRGRSSRKSSDNSFLRN